MKRDIRSFLDDITESTTRIIEYTKNKTQNDYENDDLLHDGILRRLEIIGEAVRHIPNEFRIKYPDISWKEIAGLRDVLIHEYFGVNDERIWKTITEDIPKLQKQIEQLSASLEMEPV